VDTDISAGSRQRQSLRPKCTVSFPNMRTLTGKLQSCIQWSFIKSLFTGGLLHEWWAGQKASSADSDRDSSK
jgi:hypothetical protein